MTIFFKQLTEGYSFQCFYEKLFIDCHESSHQKDYYDRMMITTSQQIFISIVKNILLRQYSMILLCVTLASLFLVNSNASSLAFSANQKRSFVGQFVVNIGFQSSSLETPYWDLVRPVITVAMPSTLAVSNNSNIDYSAIIGELQTYSLTIFKIFVFRKEITSSQLMFQISTYDAGLLKKLTVKYLVCIRESQPINFQIMTANNYYGYDGIQIYRSNYTGEFLSQIPYPIKKPNISKQYNIVTMISGINVMYNINNIFDISVLSTIFSSNLIKIIIQSKYSSQYTIMYQIYLTIFLYISPNLSNQYKYYHGTITISSGKKYQFENDYDITSINTLVGLRSFYLYYQPDISFFITVNQSDGIVVSTADQFSTSNILGFDYLVIESFYCDYKEPYFEESSQLCYSECPARTTPNDSSLSCECLINGTAVNNSQCLTQIQANPSSVQTAIIIGIVIGSLATVVLFLVILKKYKKKGEENPQSQLHNKHEANKQIKFDSKLDSIQVIYRSQNRYQDNISLRNQIVQAQYLDSLGPKNIKKNKIRKRKSQYFGKKVVWLSSKKCHSRQQICCTCLSEDTFVVSECQHCFHLSHLLQWILKKDTCPFCKERLNGQVKYYCNVCSMKFRILKLNEQIDENKLEKVCNDCQ